MARPLRLQFPGAVYHVTGRGNARQKVFFTDADRELFLRTLSDVVSRYRWICHAYCLMPNHYHLLIETPKPNLSLGMRQLNGIYTQRFNRRHHRGWSSVSRAIQGDPGGKGLSSVGALSLRRAQSGTGQRQRYGAKMEME